MSTVLSTVLRNRISCTIKWDSMITWNKKRWADYEIKCKITVKFA